MYAWLRRLFNSPAGDSARDRAIVVPEVELAHTDTEAFGVSWMQRNEVAADFNHWLFNVHDRTDIFVTPLEQQVLAALEKIANSKQSGAKLVRRLPGVVPQLLQSLRTNDFSGADLARRISNDVVLVVEVIRLANSAFFASGKSIDSIEHAVLVLGQNGLRQLISGVAFKPIIDLKSGHFTRMIAPRLWQQSEQCALANRLLADGGPVNHFEAFLAGLVQNVGLIVSLRVMEQVAEDDTALGSESFCNALIDYTRILSASIAREWQFSPAIVKAIEEQGSQYNPLRISSLGRILLTGDYLSKVSLLEQHEHLRSDATKGLSEKTMACLAQIKQSVQPDGGIQDQRPD